MSRLTKRNADGTAWYNHTAEREVKNGDILDKLANYEDLEEQGRLIELPCKVEDTVWCIDSFNLDGTLRKQPIIREIEFNHHHLEFVGKTVFLTKAEAEQKLAELKGGGSNENSL